MREKTPEALSLSVIIHAPDSNSELSSPLTSPDALCSLSHSSQQNIAAAEKSCLMKVVGYSLGNALLFLALLRLRTLFEFQDR